MSGAVVTAPTVERSGWWADAAGLLIVAGAIGWVFVSAAASGGKPAPVALLLAAAAGAWMVGRLVTPRVPLLVPAAVAFGLGLQALGVFGTWPDDPLGYYANSTAALYLQGTIAAAMVAAGARTWWIRAVGLAAAIGLAAATVRAGSAAGSILLILPAAALVMRSERATRIGVTVFGGLLAVSLAVTVVLGATYSPADRSGGVDRLVDATLTERRPALWHDALDLMSAHPLTGVGPGRFNQTSPVALSDQDAAWAHNGFLQQGAEGGVPALLLLLALFVWAFWRLRAVAGPVAVLGAVSLAALGIGSSIDIVLHFPAAPLAAAALVGAACARQGPRESGGADGRDVAAA